MKYWICNRCKWTWQTLGEFDGRCVACGSEDIHTRTLEEAEIKNVQPE